MSEALLQRWYLSKIENFRRLFKKAASSICASSSAPWFGFCQQVSLQNCLLRDFLELMGNIVVHQIDPGVKIVKNLVLQHMRHVSSSFFWKILPWPSWERINLALESFISWKSHHENWRGTSHSCQGIMKWCKVMSLTFQLISRGPVGVVAVSSDDSSLELRCEFLRKITIYCHCC